MLESPGSEIYDRSSRDLDVPVDGPLHEGDPLDGLDYYGRAERQVSGEGRLST